MFIVLDLEIAAGEEFACTSLLCLALRTQGNFAVVQRQNPNIYWLEVSFLRYSKRRIKKEKSPKHKRASSTLWHIYCCWSGISSHLVTSHYMPLLLQGLLRHQQMHCQWRWSKNLCFATLAQQIFCPHPSFLTFACLYLVPTGWYEVGVDVQSRKRWRRWVYRSAISLEWVIRVDQWSRVEVTRWSENFDRGPHNSHNHTS